MDPTLPQPPMAAMNQQGMQADPNAMQNALMLQAIKAGAVGGAAPPAAPTAQAMGPTPMSPPMAPVDPGTMTGGLGMPQPPMAATNQQAMQPNPVASALMSQIPGGQ